jgi:transposase-like protein
MDLRPQRALTIAQQEGQITIIDENTFRVKSQSHEGSYLVTRTGEDWKCECPDFIARQTPCKHIYAVSFLPSLRVNAKTPVVQSVELESPEVCVYCKSKSIVKRGFVNGKARKVQRFWCKECGKTFVFDLGFKKMKYDPRVITIAIDAYSRGMSFRDVSQHLEQFYVAGVNATTVFRWHAKYIKMIGEYVNTLQPQLSGTWHADEVFQKMRGGIKYNGPSGMAFLWNIMDRNTRFLVASKLSKARDVGGAARAFIEAAKNAHDSEPDKVFTDSLKAYSEGITFAPFTKDPEHIANAGINKPHATNNRIERLNGTERQRFKVQRGWKSMKTAIPEGHRIHYNYVRPHMALDEQTPAQAAGIDLKLDGNTHVRRQAGPSLVPAR